MDNPIRNFVEAIIKQAGLDSMPQDFIDDYIDRMTIEAQKRLGIAAMEELNAEEIKEFSELAEKNEDAPVKLNEYLQSHIDDYQNKMTAALQQFGKEVIESANKLK